MEWNNVFADASAKQRKVPKGQHVFRQGEKTDRICLIQQGLIKAYYETRDGKEFIKSFIAEGGIIASLQAIVERQPSTFSVLALEDCIILELPKSVLDARQAQDPGLAQQMYAFVIQLAMKKERREFEFLCLPAEERYRLFCEREPELVARLSQMDIARYLGITPVALSRIRHRLSSRGLR